MASDSESPSPRPVELAVELAADAADAPELEALTASLRRQLLRLDVDRVDRLPGREPPADARALETFALGALAVRLVGRPETLAAIAGTVRAWLGGHSDRTVKLQLGENVLELTGVSSSQQERLIDEWIEQARA